MDSSQGKGRPGGPIHWRLRRRLAPQLRGHVRRSLDAVVAPLLGSLAGFPGAEAVALTLDDGPDPDVTPGVLQALGAWGSTATFFVLLHQARQHPDLVRAIVDGAMRSRCTEWITAA